MNTHMAVLVVRVHLVLPYSHRQHLDKAEKVELAEAVAVHQ